MPLLPSDKGTAPQSLNNDPPSPPSSSSSLLTLPPELRLKIYLPLLLPLTYPLTITPLFIRAHYKTLFMSQHPKQIATNLLLICRQITTECLPILYGLPVWRASCRLEQLASQIGVENFGFIRRMEVDSDDLGAVLGGLRREVKFQQEQEQHRQGNTVLESINLSNPRFLRFGNLESLSVEGWQKVALTSRGSKGSRIEGRGLCFMAMGVLSVAPRLDVLVQIGDDGGMGGSDARDLSMGRVKWRFLRSMGETRTGTSRDRSGKGIVDGGQTEHVVDLVEMIALFDALIEMDEVEERGTQSESWRGGVFRQYPYLARD